MAIAVVINLFLYIANLMFIFQKNLESHSVDKGKIAFVCLNMISLCCGIFVTMLVFTFSSFGYIMGFEESDFKSKIINVAAFLYFIVFNLVLSILVIRKKVNSEPT
ncbi:hypothetical protein CSE16_06880 [Solibacillus sp. R5-41]|uniref:hypothetical protein n=1 Tax=Solibacillus sp. R5-41 TaxID=2048654 RepID=UPI000C126826|nr:hypothetical protein [Solibacillus sp. R5-41]ATP39798.1 hypothetical protein CSE16_06880 [Solibacillus sp. R5-41]